jgi:hypothetical protein
MSDMLQLVVVIGNIQAMMLPVTCQLRFPNLDDKLEACRTLRISSAMSERHEFVLLAAHEKGGLPACNFALLQLSLLSLEAGSVI